MGARLPDRTSSKHARTTQTHTAHGASGTGIQFIDATAPDSTTQRSMATPTALLKITGQPLAQQFQHPIFETKIPSANGLVRVTGTNDAKRPLEPKRRFRAWFGGNGGTEPLLSASSRQPQGSCYPHATAHRKLMHRARRQAHPSNRQSPLRRPRAQPSIRAFRPARTLRLREASMDQRLA